MKKSISLLTSVLFIGLIACEKEEIIFNPSSDAFIITKTIETETEVDTLYGIALHVFANKPMQNVSVSPDDGTDATFELSAYEGYLYDFYYQTAVEDFSTTKPFIGDYIFSISAQSTETETMTDGLLDDFIYPTDTLKCIYDISKDEMNVNWTKIDDADYIVVNMFNDNDELVFNGTAFVGSAVKYTFSKTKSGWVNGETPIDGADYTVEMDAYMYESGLSGLNLQAKAISVKNVTWGE